MIEKCLLIYLPFPNLLYMKKLNLHKLFAFMLLGYVVKFSHLGVHHLLLAGSVPIALTVGGCFLPGTSGFDGVGGGWPLCSPLVSRGADVTASSSIGGLPNACLVFAPKGSTVA